MSQNEMISKIEQLREWETLLEEAQSEVEALRDSIKAEMLEQGTEELQVGAYIIRWTSVQIYDYRYGPVVKNLVYY